MTMKQYIVLYDVFEYAHPHSTLRQILNEFKAHWIQCGGYISPHNEYFCDDISMAEMLLTHNNEKITFWEINNAPIDSINDALLFYGEQNY